MIGLAIYLTAKPIQQYKQFNIDIKSDLAQQSK